MIESTCSALWLARISAWEGKLVQTQFRQEHSLNESQDQNDALNDYLVILNGFSPETLAVEQVSRIASSKGEGCKKELSLPILLNKFSLV